jgi:outer membrane receptor protein involved in Fe transport
MMGSNRYRLTLCVAASLLLTASYAGSAYATEAAAEDSGLEEITVTAEKFTSTIQNTPISMSAVS